MKKRIFIKLFTCCVLFGNHISIAQKTNNFKLNLELDLVQPILGGYGATIGFENNNWGAGIMGFNTPLSPQSRNFIMKGADDYNVQNWGMELYTQYFINENHKGLHFGALISVDGYEMSHSSHPKQTLIGTYVVPKIGYRWIISKKIEWLYLQPSIATPILVWNDFSKIKTTSITPSKIIFLPLLTLGFKIPLS